jgi:hypothetical protein
MWMDCDAQAGRFQIGKARHFRDSEPKEPVMLVRVATLAGYTLDSLEGEIGKVSEFYFDDKHWIVRYMVADTGNWLPGRLVLISPYALVDVDKEKRHVAVNLTKEQIENSPSLESHKPVSRQNEEVYNNYYSWPLYWDGPFVWGAYPAFERDRGALTASARSEQGWDAHLRSSGEVKGYHIQGIEGEIGHLEDIIIDDATWSIRYLVIDTRNWWPGKKVLVSTQWVDGVSWNESKVFLGLSLESIRHSPEYSEDALLTRDYEDRLHRHYQRRGYWNT